MSLEQTLIRSIDGMHSDSNPSGFIPFNPILADSYKTQFVTIAKQLASLGPEQRVAQLNVEIEKNTTDIDSENINLLKFVSSLSVLRDLLSQGWRMLINELLLLAPPQLIEIDKKAFLRQQLQQERNTQFKNPSIKVFIQRMERLKKYMGAKINISNLIGNSQLILEKIRTEAGKVDSGNDSVAIDPYLQLVTNKNCSQSGYKLMDLWRYFRYNWSIPYKSTPGRNLFYLIRDASQPYHPIMGIAALGNCVLQLTHRDNYIGWTVEAIKSELKKELNRERYHELTKDKSCVSKEGESVAEIETENEYFEHIHRKSLKILNDLTAFLEKAIDDISKENLLNDLNISNPSDEMIDTLKQLADGLKKEQLNNKRSVGAVDWMNESNSPLYKKKRAMELAKLLEAKKAFNTVLESEPDANLSLRKLLNLKRGKYVQIALQASRKSKIGSNIMEIIVCGAIPPYNELLVGKLVALLICSPSVVKDYSERYSQQVSEIASRMKGEEIVRDSQLAYLGTTSLYQMGSSQYNRIKMPVGKTGAIEYKRLGETEGVGSVFFSQQTTRLISSMLHCINGGRKISNVFGEGTSPRLRLIRSGMSALGISSEVFLKHHTKRIVYGITLASNSREFLTGKDTELKYFFPLDGKEERYTNDIIKFWRDRWFNQRSLNVDIQARLQQFEKSSMLISKNF
jgi:hypothetical protein